LRLDYNDDDWATDAIDWRKELNIADDENLKNNYGIRGVIITGNLTVNGSIVNSDMNGGPFLLMTGNVAAHNLVAGGAHMVIKGNANVRDVAYGHYNDGSIQINGDLSAPIFINEDHDFGFNALKNNQFKYDFNNDDLGEDDDGNPKIPKKLRALLDDDIKDWADLTSSLKSGEHVLKTVGKVSAVKDAAYWQKLVSMNSNNLKKVPKAFVTAELCETALNQNAWAFNYIPTKLITPAMCEKAIADDGHLLEYVPEKLKTKLLCQAAMANNCNLQYVPSQHVDYPMALQAVQANSSNINYVPQGIINQELLIAFMINADYQGYYLQSYFKKPRTYTAEDVIMQIVPKSFEVFAKLPAMYTTKTCLTLPKSCIKIMQIGRNCAMTTIAMR
jgi:hypothetical protein